MNKANQHELILSYMRQHVWITPWDCAQNCRSLKLSTRIGELKEAGYQFDIKWVERNGKRYKKYRMVG